MKHGISVKLISLLALIILVLSTVFIPGLSFPSVTASAAAAGELTYTNSMINGADPFVLLHDGVYYLYATNAPETGFVVYTSQDLTNWKNRGYALKEDDGATVFGNDWFWAPEVFEYDGRFFMIYAANERLAIASADTPLGPFTQSTVGPLTLRASESAYTARPSGQAGYLSNGEIDGHFFEDTNGSLYLYFVRYGDNYGNAIYGSSISYANGEFTVDRSTITRLISANSSGWEKSSLYVTVTEGPEMLKHNGKYYLSYSANGYTDQNYAVGYATSSSPLGTFTKYSGNPILKKDAANGVYGTGHHCFVMSPDGSEMFIVYHRHHDSSAVIPRQLCIDRAYFDSNGVLTVNGPTTTAQPLPSGVPDFETGVFADLKTLPIVYVKATSGDDTANGLTKATAVATIFRAYEILGSAGGTIMFCENFSIAGAADSPNTTDYAYFATPSYVTGPVRITGETPNIVMNLKFMELNSDHLIDNLTIKAYTNATSIIAQFHNLTIGNNVYCVCDTTDNVAGKYPFIIGGHLITKSTATTSPYKYFTPAVKTYETVSTDKDYTITVNSGTFRSVRGGNWREYGDTPVGLLEGNVTINFGGMATYLPYSGANDNYLFTATGMSSLATGASATINITGGTLCGAIYALGRPGSIDAGLSYDRICEGNLTINITGGKFKTFTADSGAVRTPVIAARQDSVVSPSGAFRVNISGDPEFDAGTVISASGASYIRTAYADSGYLSANNSNIAYTGFTYVGSEPVYFVNNGVSASGNGKTAATAFKTISEALEAFPETGGRLVVCGAVTFTNWASRVTDGEVIVTSSYGGVDYAVSNSAKLNASGYWQMGCDIVLTDITYNCAISAPFIYAGFNNLTICEDFRLTKNSSSYADPSLFLGFRCANVTPTVAATQTVADVSYTGNMATKIYAGSWQYFRGGNYRIGEGSPVGTFNGNEVITVGGSAAFTYTPAAGEKYGTPFTASGMNIQKGTLTLRIKGGSFTSGIYGLSKLGTYKCTTTSSYVKTEGLDGDTAYDTDIRIIITGGSFTKSTVSEIAAAQLPGDTPLTGSFSVSCTGASLGSSLRFSALGTLGASSASVPAAYASTCLGFDSVNGTADSSEKALRIMCIGDSITWGTGTSAASGLQAFNYSYPAQLQTKYGDTAVVGNFGFPGSRGSAPTEHITATSLSSSYYGSTAYNLSLGFSPDVIVIALGTNDYGNSVYQYTEHIYKYGMEKMIESYHTAFPDAVIYLSTALNRDSTAASGTNSNRSYTAFNIVAMQKEIADAYSYVTLIDTHTSLYDYLSSTYFCSDLLHPNNTGYTVLANEIYKGINGQSLTTSSVSSKISTVYYSSSGTGNGSSRSAPTSDIVLAFERLPDEGGTIVLLDSCILTGGTATRRFNGTVTLKGDTASVVFACDNAMYINSDFVFDNVTLRITGSAPRLILNYHSLTVTDSVSVSVNSGDIRPGIIAGYVLVANDRFTASMTELSCSRDINIAINGGEWLSFTGGCVRDSAYASLSYYSGTMNITASGAEFSGSVSAVGMNLLSGTSFLRFNSGNAGGICALGALGDTSKLSLSGLSDTGSAPVAVIGADSQISVYASGDRSGITGASLPLAYLPSAATVNTSGFSDISQLAEIALPSAIAGKSGLTVCCDGCDCDASEWYDYGDSLFTGYDYSDITASGTFSSTVSVFDGADSYVYLISESSNVISAVRAAALDNAVSYVGTAIRTSGNAGMRMKSAVNMSAFGTDYTLSAVGTCARYTSNVALDGVLSIGSEDTGTGYAYIAGNASYGDGLWWALNDPASGTNTFTSVLVEIAEADYAKEVSFRGFCTFTAGGIEYTIYAPVTSRSVYSVAKQCTGSDATNSFVTGIISSVEG